MVVEQLARTAFFLAHVSDMDLRSGVPPHPIMASRYRHSLVSGSLMPYLPPVVGPEDVYKPRRKERTKRISSSGSPAARYN